MLQCSQVITPWLFTWIQRKCYMMQLAQWLKTIYKWTTWFRSYSQCTLMPFLGQIGVTVLQVIKARFFTVETLEPNHQVHPGELGSRFTSHLACYDTHTWACIILREVQLYLDPQLTLNIIFTSVLIWPSSGNYFRIIIDWATVCYCWMMDLLA